MGRCFDWLCCRPKPPVPARDESNTSSSDTQTTSRTSSISLVHRNTIMVAIWDYAAGGETELTLRKGDHVQFIQLDEQKKWMLVSDSVSGRRGFVPANFLAAIGSNICEEWYFGPITRREAEDCLHQSSLLPGDFLIWFDTGGEKSHFVLSVRSLEEGDDGRFVSHFVIIETARGRFQLEADVHAFKSLSELVDHYKVDGGALPMRLHVAPRRPMPERKDLSRQTAHMWELDRRQIHLDRVLGKGHFADVYLATWRRGGVEPIGVAVKQLKPGTMDRQEFIREAATMKNFDHCNLVRLYGVCADAHPFWIVTEHMVNGALTAYLTARHKAGRPLRARQLVDVSVQIARAMAYLEKKRLVHRDLAARNVLVGEEAPSILVKVSDFGMARLLGDDPVYRMRHADGVSLPIKWLAPECMERFEFSPKSDVWAYGVVLCEIFSHGCLPYPGVDTTEVYAFLKNGKRMSRPSGMPERVYALCLRCWQLTASARPTFADLTCEFEKHSIASDA